MTLLTDGSTGAATVDAMAALYAKTAAAIHRAAERAAGDEGLTEPELAALRTRWRRPPDGLPACSGFHDHPLPEGHLCGWCDPGEDWRPPL